jgi:hypothetical protein
MEWLALILVIAAIVDLVANAWSSGACREWDGANEIDCLSSTTESEEEGPVILRIEDSIRRQGSKSEGDTRARAA